MRTTGSLRSGARWWLLLGLGLLALVVVACSPADEEDSLTVFAAASLRDVVTELEAAWAGEHPDVPLTIATEASNVLAAQISEGAPADVFISADAVYPWRLSDAGLTAAEPTPFATNSLALVAPLGDARVLDPSDLAQPGVRIVGISPGAPIARYTIEVIAGLADTMSEPQAFAAAVDGNVVSHEDNVRAALAKIELGEGDAAFVYTTDARGSEDVRAIALPESVDVTAEYTAVPVSERALSAQFVRWLREPTATAVIEAAGFEVGS